MRNQKRHQTVKTVLSKKSNAGKITIPGLKIYYRVIVKIILIKNQYDTGTETGMQINGIKLKTQT